MKDASNQGWPAESHLFKLPQFQVSKKQSIYDKFVGAKTNWGLPTVAPMLKIQCADVYESTYGPHKTMIVSIYSPRTGNFTPVAAFSTCRNPMAHEFVKDFYRNTPVYRPNDGFDNYFYPGHNTENDPISVKKLQVYDIVDIMLLGNYPISLPFNRVPEWECPYDLTFTLCEFGFEFYGWGIARMENDPSFTLNGYTFNASYNNKFATVGLLCNTIAEHQPTPVFSERKMHMDAIRTFDQT
jgi:hypothetical protein